MSRFGHFALSFALRFALCFALHCALRFTLRDRQGAVIAGPTGGSGILSSPASIREADVTR
jgi:hypothetical protein